jgi:putative transposase
MRKVPAPKVVTALGASEIPLPPRIREALGELVGAAREGLLALGVGVGLAVVREPMEAEVTEVVGPKGKHNRDREAKRHGHQDGSMTLGGRRVKVGRARMRTADDEHELPVATYRYFADRDRLTRAVIDRMLAGVLTRKFAVVGEPVGSEVEDSSSATSKSTISESFVERTRTALGELMSRRLDDVRLAVMMLDGWRSPIAPTSSRWGSRPRATRSRSGGGRAAPRTPHSPGCCWPTRSTAALTPSRRSCS